MAILLITPLIIIIFILVAICAHREAQISSLKRQIHFLEYSIDQFMEGEKQIHKEETDIGKILEVSAG